jgi:hypothetical protein
MIHGIGTQACSISHTSYIFVFLEVCLVFWSIGFTAESVNPGIIIVSKMFTQLHVFLFYIVMISF